MCTPYFVLLLSALHVLPFCSIVSAAECYKKYTRDSGNFASPNLEGLSTKSTYDNDLSCTYEIKLTDKNKGIILTWTKFDVNGDMPKCSNDYVEIFIGCKEDSIGKYCSNNLLDKTGHQVMFKVYSPDNCLRIKFRSDSSDTGGGIKATYSYFANNFGGVVYTSEGSPSTCSSYRKDYTKSAGAISSPNWPSGYPANKDCYSAIKVGDENGVKIAFMDFDLKPGLFGCDNVKVKVKGNDVRDSYNSATTIKDSFCGSKDPFVFHSSKKQVWIRFKNDGPSGRDVYRGFVLGYVVYKRTEGFGGTVGVVVGLVIAAAVVFCCVGGYWYRRKRRFQGQRVPTNPPPLPPAQAQHPVPPPTQSYPMQPVVKGYPPPPSYNQVTTGSYYPPPGVHQAPPPGGVYPPPPPGGTYPTPPPGGVYPPGPPGGMYTSPPPGGVYPSGYSSGPPPPGEPYSAPPPSAPGEAAPYPVTAPQYPPAGGAGYPPSTTAPYPTS